MRIRLILQRLADILERANRSREDALECIGTAEFLLDFIDKAAEVNGVGNMPGVREYLRDIRKALYHAAGLNDDDADLDRLMDFARRALSVLRMSALLGQKPELLTNAITNDGRLLSM